MHAGCMLFIGIAFVYLFHALGIRIGGYATSTGIHGYVFFDGNERLKRVCDRYSQR